MKQKIAIIGGDGIGPGLAAQAVKILNTLKEYASLELELVELTACGASVDRCGDPLPPEVLRQALECRAVLFGNIGGKKYRDLPFEQKPERTLMEMRRAFEVCTNLRPVFLLPGMETLSPLKPELLAEGMSVIVVRDIRGGMLAGPHDEWNGTHGKEACDLEYYDEATVELTARRAFELARTRTRTVCSLDKANVLASSVLWRKKVEQISRDYPDVALRHCYIDAASMEVLRQPWAFDVVLTCNVFGDIISDELAQISGAPVLFGSAELAPDGRGLYTSNQLHNSHEELAETDGAHPAGLINATAMMLEYSLGRPDLAQRVRRALSQTMQEGLATAELCLQGQKAVTASAFGDRVAELLRASCEGK